jgi:mercuric ion transport protein
VQFLETLIRRPRTASNTQRSALKTPTHEPWLLVGALLSAIAASSCCVLPLVLFGLGASGAWIGSLTALAPYQPYFIASALAFLGSGFYFAYRKSPATCEADDACALRRQSRGVKAMLWLAAAVVSAAIAFPYLAPSLLGSP